MLWVEKKFDQKFSFYLLANLFYIIIGTFQLNMCQSYVEDDRGTIDSLTDFYMKLFKLPISNLVYK